MEIDNIDHNLTCVLFPGIVKNDERAIECLGGLKTISQISTSTKKKLALSFQPENPYVKKIYADEKKCAGLLLKVKVKKTQEGNQTKKEVISTTVLGRVTSMHKFESLCDFQYLPLVTDPETSQPKCILDDLVPSGLESINFLKEPAPLFISPTSFTRADKPISFSYTDTQFVQKEDRSTPGCRFVFNLTDEMPTKPPDFYVQQHQTRLQIYPQLAKEREIVEKMFQEKPIWSMTAMRYHTKVRLMSLKVIMPCLSVYSVGGPWRSMWIKFGYDPRLHPEARMYQCLDFRIRSTGGMNALVTDHKHKKGQSKRKAKGSDTAEKQVAEANVYFRPGFIPTQKQVSYQYGDIELDEVRSLLETATAVCDERRGWVAAGVAEECRDHIFRHVSHALISTNSAGLNLEESDAESGDQNSDDEASDRGEDDTAQ